MACEVRNTNSNNSRQNYILEVLKKIAADQKAVAVTDTFVGCRSSLLLTNNTKPVRFTLCCGALYTATIDNNGDPTPTTLFRVEEVCGNSVILRLLNETTTTTECTDYTTILNVDCVCGMQCYPPINCLG